MPLPQCQVVHLESALMDDKPEPAASTKPQYNRSLLPKWFLDSATALEQSKELSTSVKAQLTDVRKSLVAFDKAVDRAASEYAAREDCEPEHAGRAAAPICVWCRALAAEAPVLDEQQAQLGFTTARSQELLGNTVGPEVAERRRVKLEVAEGRLVGGPPSWALLPRSPESGGAPPPRAFGKGPRSHW